MNCENKKVTVYQHAEKPYYYMLRSVRTWFVRPSFWVNWSIAVVRSPSSQFPNQCEAVVCCVCWAATSVIIALLLLYVVALLRRIAEASKALISWSWDSVAETEQQVAAISWEGITRVTVHFSILISFELLLSTRAENHWEAVLSSSWALSRCAIRHHQLRLGAAHILYYWLSVL